LASRAVAAPPPAPGGREEGEEALPLIVAQLVPRPEGHDGAVQLEALGDLVNLSGVIGTAQADPAADVVGLVEVLHLDVHEGRSEQLSTHRADVVTDRARA